MPGAIDGLKTKAKIPPISPRMNPITYPPIAVTQLSIDSTKTIAPHIVWDFGLEYIITPPTIMMIPKITPTRPSASRVLLAEPAPAMLREDINEPAKARVAPPKITNMPPISDRTIAAVGLSPKFDHALLGFTIYNTFDSVRSLDDFPGFTEYSTSL
jgi:hypothetical protein